MLFYFYLLKTSMRTSMSKRGAFLIEASLSIVNNLIFFSLWWIFFRQFNDIGGWKIEDLMALIAVGMGAYGLMQICFGGIKNLSRIIVDGDLDPFMTQPKNPLLHILGSRSFAKGWGHVMTSVIMVCLGGLTSPQSIAIVAISAVSGCLVFTSINVIAHSLPFWLGSVEGLSRKYADAVFLFALYPTNIYSGVLQLVMFTVIPAGVIGYLPVELIRDFGWTKLLILLVSAACFVAVASFVFSQGLKRYESGSKFGLRA